MNRPRQTPRESIIEHFREFYQRVWLIEMTVLGFLDIYINSCETQRNEMVGLYCI